jgi:HEAT repeat protein
MTTMNALRIRKLGSNLLGTVALTAGIALAGTATAADVKPYQGIPADQAESISSPDHIMSVVRSGAPTEIWQALEHGEVVECLQCIGVVSPLLYSSNAKNREIAAWWLRRRIFGVFGPGEVYSQTVDTLASDSSATRRADAASALGEFLVLNGVAPVAHALTSDTDPGVRAAAASALGRLNDDGAGALAKAFSDSDATVRVAAFQAAGKVNSFTDVSSAVAVTGDSNALVRRVGIELLDAMGATDAAEAVLKLAQTDPDSEVRLVSCHALGAIGDPSMVSELQAISTNDTNQQVQDQAAIAVLRLTR